MVSGLPGGVDFSHYLLQKYIKKGDVVVDATAGNGYDTLFVARLTGKSGRVYAFDIQPQAIENTRQRLMENGLLSGVELITTSHEQLSEYVSEKVKAIIFNLGYLPGGDKSITTTTEITLKAVKEGLKLLTGGGIIVLVVYSGHQEGKKEDKALLDYVSNLDYREYNVLDYHFLNQLKPPPRVLAIYKRHN